MTAASYLQIEADGRVSSFVGPDAVALFHARALRAAIAAYMRFGLRPTRGVGPSRMLAMASGITGKPYRRGAYASAIADLTTWIAALESALPIVRAAAP